MNKNFCYHPWAGFDVTNEGDIKPCCKFQPDLENWPKFNVSHGIENYINSKQLTDLKQQFLNGKSPSGCVQCWKDESAQYPSKRQMDAQRWKHQLDQYSLDDDGFLFLTLPLGNFCNLKCRICGPDASTSWIKEHHDLFFEKWKAQNWHKNTKIWNDIIAFSKNSLEIHIHGGEPFLYDSIEHLDLLENLVNCGSSNQIRLHYSTNGTIYPREEYWKLWKKFHWVDIQVSIDDIGERFEYNRHPAKWNEVEYNLRKLQQQISNKNNLQLSISSTVSAFTVYYLDELFNYTEINQLPKPWLGRLQEPYYYKVGIFPENIKNTIVKKLENSKHQDVRKISSWLSDDESVHWRKFLEMIELHDNYRQENFTKIFPELAELVNE